VKRKNYEAPHYAVFSRLLPHPPSYVQISPTLLYLFLDELLPLLFSLLSFLKWKEFGM